MSHIFIARYVLSGIGRLAVNSDANYLYARACSLEQIFEITFRFSSLGTLNSASSCCGDPAKDVLCDLDVCFVFKAKNLDAFIDPDKYGERTFNVFLGAILQSGKPASVPRDCGMPAPDFECAPAFPFSLVASIAKLAVNIFVMLSCLDDEGGLPHTPHAEFPASGFRVATSELPFSSAFLRRKSCREYQIALTLINCFFTWCWSRVATLQFRTGGSQ